MEKNNRNDKKGLIIAIFSIILLVLVGWIIYDKITNKNPNKPIDNPTEKVEKYDLYNKIENGLLVSVSNDAKNIFHYYAVCDDSCDEYDMNQFEINNKNELIYKDDNGQKYILTDNVKSINSYKPDDDHFEYGELVIYETLDGEKYILTEDNENEKLAAINVKNVYGIVEDIYIITNLDIAENVAKYNGNIINAIGVFYGVSFDFNSSFSDETADTIYVVTTDDKVLYLQAQNENVWKDTNIKSNQLKYDNVIDRIRFKAKYTEISVRIVF